MTLRRALYPSAVDDAARMDPCVEMQRETHT